MDQCCKGQGGRVGTHREGDVLIMRPVQLVPACSVSAGAGNLLDGAGGGGAQHVGQAQLGSNLGHADLSVGMEDGLDADGSDQDRTVVLLAQDVDGQIAMSGLSQHAWDHLAEHVSVSGKRDIEGRSMSTFHWRNARRLASIVAFSPAPPAT